MVIGYDVVFGFGPQIREHQQEHGILISAFCDI